MDVVANDRISCEIPEAYLHDKTYSFIGVNPSQTTWTDRSAVSGRETLLFRSAEA